MYYIAICDDETFTCSAIEQQLLDLSEKANIPMQVDVFYSGNGFINYLRNKIQYDILFLDIELQDINGIEIARYLRNSMNDEHIQIIYISSKTEYALKLFKNRPMDFLVKPFTVDDIEHCFEYFKAEQDADRHLKNVKNQMLYNEIYRRRRKGR